MGFPPSQLIALLFPFAWKVESFIPSPVVQQWGGGRGVCGKGKTPPLSSGTIQDSDAMPVTGGGGTGHNYTAPAVLNRLATL